MPVANDQKSKLLLVHAVNLFKPRRGAQKHFMVLHFSQATDNRDENNVIVESQLLTQLRAALFVVCKLRQIESQRNYSELRRVSNSKLLVDFTSLLLTDYDDAIGCQP